MSYLLPQIAVTSVGLGISCLIIGVILVLIKSVVGVLILSPTIPILIGLIFMLISLMAISIAVFRE